MSAPLYHGNYWALNGLVHLDYPGGNDVTFCGDALEGDEGDRPAMAVVPQRLSCERCMALLNHGTSIPRKHFSVRRKAKQ